MLQNKDPRTRSGESTSQAWEGQGRPSQHAWKSLEAKVSNDEASPVDRASAGQKFETKLLCSPRIPLCSLFSARDIPELVKRQLVRPESLAVDRLYPGSRPDGKSQEAEGVRQSLSHQGVPAWHQDTEWMHRTRE